MEAKARCIAILLNVDLVITGGAERINPTTGKRHHTCRTSAHHSSDALDFSFDKNPTLPGSGEEFFCAALKCGFEWGWYEPFKKQHYHIQRIPGCGVPKIVVDRCKCHVE